MKRSLLILLLPVLLFCGCGSGAPASEEAEALAASVGRVVEEIRPVFRPAFLCDTIPPAVEARMRGNSYPEDATIPFSELRYLRVAYYDFYGVQHMGELVCNVAIAEDLLEIFRALYEAKYPIHSIRLVDDYGGSDEASMRADNTSCFNYRTMTGQKKLSRHALGMAIDINPLENPYIDPRGGIHPAEGASYADRTRDFPHKIDRGDLCYKLFREHGFSWGGAWSRSKDYQHFQK